MARIIVTIAVVACAVAAASTVGAVSGSASESSARAGERAQLADVRRATARYHHESLARRDGYVRAGDCAQAPGLGAMGIHYINPQLAADATVDPRRPELLLYEPQTNGRMRLVGVEWFIADRDQDLSTDDDRPSLFGHAFDGPMPGHDPGMAVHYDLHAYLWRHNPAGTFAAWNANVHCPPAE